MMIIVRLKQLAMLGHANALHPTHESSDEYATSNGAINIIASVCNCLYHVNILKAA